MNTVFITGVNGFIGSHIAERFLAMDYKVRGLVRKTSDLKFIEGFDIDLHYGDILDEASLAEPVQGAELVVHVAGLASDWGPYRRFHEINVQGTCRVARAAQASGVKRFVHISTAALNGFPGARGMTEEFPGTKTIFPYCETKREAEQWLFKFAGKTEMEITAVRPGNVFGPRDHTFIEKYLEVLESGKAAYINKGRHWTCPSYIENLTDGIILAATEPAAAGEAFTITDGLDITWKQFTDALADALGVKRPTLSVPYSIGYVAAFSMEMVYKALRIKTPPLLTRYRISNGGRDYHFSIEKARRLLHYEPKVDFREAVRRTVDWYRGR